MRLVVRFALAAALGAAALPAHAQNPTSSAIAAAQAGPAPANAALDLSSGEAIYKSGCITCHGPTGAGMPSTTVGFEQPDTFPDFTRCDQTTPELDIDYSAIIRDGGPARGFSPIMPAFGDLLTRTQIAAVVGYLRGFCGNHTWPLGELNLPRPLVTEKAFPESETIVTGAVTAQRSPDTTGTIQYEQRLSLRNQFEISLPLAVMHDPSGAAHSGVGDVALGLKHVLFSSRASGSLLSAQGEIIVPTGNADRGLGSGTTVFEAFGAFAQLLPRDLFLQLQAGTEQPTDIEKASRAVYGHAAFGRMFRAGGGFGRLWSPMVELIADRDLETGASANFDLIPQFQVTLSRRQHVRVNAGLQVPVNNRDGRSTQVVFYALWDWFDGRLTEGW